MFNICLAVLSFTVTDGKIQNFKVISSGAKKKIKIPKKIDLAEIRAVGRNGLVV
jgi:hypothetical protein